MANVQPYLDLITSQHRTKPNFMTWLEAGLKPVDALETTAGLTDVAFDLDTAAGYQLDILGLILGLSRKLNFQPTSGSDVLDDGYYRLCLKAKIVKNQWNGTRASLEQTVKQIFPLGALEVIDNQDMSVDIYLLNPGETDPYLIELLKHEYLIPRPEGVLYNYVIFNKPVFAWDKELSAFYGGWNQADWMNR